jgi:hypothetical protein
MPAYVAKEPFPTWPSRDVQRLCDNRVEEGHFLELKAERIGSDLPLNLHPTALKALAGFTPWGAGGATCDRLSWGCAADRTCGGIGGVSRRREVAQRRVRPPLVVMAID